MCTYDLKYNDYNSSVSDGLRSLLATSEISDITLAVEGRFFQAHQVILSIFSPYFRELFCVNPSKHTIFFMKNVKYRIMHNLLAFMYEGMVQIPEEDFNLFWETAKELKIKGLSNDGEPHSMAKSSQAPVESVPVVGSEAMQCADRNLPKPASCLKRPAESVQASAAGAARKKSKVIAQMLHQPAPEVNVLPPAVPSTSWAPASYDTVQQDVPMFVNVTEDNNILIKKEVDCYEEENTSGGDATCNMKWNPENVSGGNVLEPLCDVEERPLGFNEGQPGFNSYMNHQVNEDYKAPKPRLFLKELAKALLKDQLQMRQNIETLPATAHTLLQSGGVQGVVGVPTPKTPSGRCYYCSSKQNRKTKQHCNKCDSFICKEHTTSYCNDCNEIIEAHLYLYTSK